MSELFNEANKSVFENEQLSNLKLKIEKFSDRFLSENIGLDQFSNEDLEAIDMRKK